MALMIHPSATASPFTDVKKVLKNVKPGLKIWNFHVFLSFFFLTFYVLISSLCSFRWASFLPSMISFYLYEFSKNKLRRVRKSVFFKSSCSLCMLLFLNFCKTPQASFPWWILLSVYSRDLSSYSWVCCIQRSRFPFTHLLIGLRKETYVYPWGGCPGGGCPQQ